MVFVSVCVSIHVVHLSTRMRLSVKEMILHVIDMSACKTPLRLSGGVSDTNIQFPLAMHIENNYDRQELADFANEFYSLAVGLRQS